MMPNKEQFAYIYFGERRFIFLLMPIHSLQE